MKAALEAIAVLVKYFGARTGAAVLFAVACLGLVWLAAGDVAFTLPEAVMLTLIVAAAAVLIVALVMRTETDRYGKMPNGGAVAPPVNEDRAEDVGP